MCNIPIYFCNIQMKHMQHPNETSETLQTYTCNIRFQRNVTLQLEGMEARRGARRRLRGRQQSMELTSAAAARKTQAPPSSSSVEAAVARESSVVEAAAASG
jgi:hypothetical protein